MISNYSNINKKESVLFDFFKIFLLLEVVLGHIGALTLPILNSLDLNNTKEIFLYIFKSSIGFGRESAYLFVLLSGFFTANIFIQKDFCVINIIRKRLFRIMPILILAIFFTAIFDLIGIYLIQSNVYIQNQMNYNVNEHLSFQLFITNILSLQPTFSLTFGSNGPIWTLGYLIQFYFLAILIKKISIIYKINFRTIFFIINILLIPIFGLEFFMLNIIWFIGFYLRTYDFSHIKLNIFITFALIILLLLIEKLSDKYIAILLTPLVGFLSLILIKKIPNQVFNINFENFPRFNDITYSWYAIHMPIVFICYALIEKIFYTNHWSFIVSLFLFSVISSILFALILNKITTPKKELNE